ncbi:MAG TPA: hypothetical protein VK631_13590, partial [Solirubrobacteraceae bacterium]|nr:hypothetical protein [Solirubrobacteraceae bacterium]
SYLDATQACARRGGYLPTAEMLVGAAGRVALAGRLDDDPATASVDTEAGDGLQDRREMSATLITTRAGSGAAGSLGTSDRSTGDPRTGEPSPPSEPADLEPVTLQYVTVVDNRNRGGFAGGVPIGEPGRFRCAFNKGGQGAPAASAPAAPAAVRLDATQRVTLAGLRESGIRPVLRCARDCRYLMELRLSARTARRLGVGRSGRKDAVIARSGRKAERIDAGGRVQVRLRPGRTIGRRMDYWMERLRLPSVTATLRVVVQPQGGRQRTLRRTVAVRRGGA